MKGEVDEAQAKSSFHHPQSNSILIVMETQNASMKKLPFNDVTIQADHKFGTYQIESTDSRSRTSPFVKASATSQTIIIVIKTAVKQKENSVRNVKSIIILPDCVNLCML